MSHLSSVAMLADFNVSQWTARKIDKNQTAELNERNRAKEGSGLVTKKLVASSTLVEIARLVTFARDQVHKRLTSPWLDNGTRIVSVHMFDQYEAAMDECEAKFRPLRDQFFDQYPALQKQAREVLGNMFDANDYPSLARVKSKFGWYRRIMPIPVESDFRATLTTAQTEKIKAQITSAGNEAAALAIRDVFERANECVSRMVESLTAFDPTKSGKERHTFHDTMIGQIRDLVTIMPGLNFTGDKRVADLSAAMVALTEHDAETLRTSDNIRAGMLTKAMDIADQVSAFMA